MIKGGSPNKSNKILRQKSPYLLDIIKELNLENKLNLVLDAADLRSYSGTGQIFKDVTDNGNNFFLGDTASSEATDPTFIGSPGLASEQTYFSFDGGDNFEETANHSFANTWHLNNGVFSIVAINYVVGSDSVIQSIFVSDGDSGGGGIDFRINTSEILDLYHYDGIVGETISSGITIPTPSWNFLGVELIENITTTNFYVNKTISSISSINFSVAINTPGQIHIGGDGPSAEFLANTSRFACLAAWSTNIGPVAISKIYSLLRERRFPSLP